MGHPVEQFENHRPLLLGLAYRLLGSMWDAEDVVQDAYLRWERTDRSAVREPRSFLLTIVSRLALDLLGSARVTREAYQGPWLPEPVPTGTLGPMDTAELRDTVSYATVHLMQRLSPPERAVFVLREAFDLPYSDIAVTVQTSETNCRQLFHRARGRLAEGSARFRSSPSEHARLLTRFLEAAESGDLSGLAQVLSEDVVAWNDGGGKARAALRPIVGPAGETPQLVEANGLPALWLTLGGQEQLVTLDVRDDGRAHALFAVLNPAKLTRIRSTIAR